MNYSFENCTTNFFLQIEVFNFILIEKKSYYTTTYTDLLVIITIGRLEAKRRPLEL